MRKKILVINPFGIGDVLFTTPVIHTLKETFKETRIGYLCNRRAAGVLKNNPFVDEFFIYERDEFEALRRKSFFLWLKEIFKFLERIKRERFELAIDFSLHSQYGFFCWLAGIKERIGYDFKKRGRFLSRKIKLNGYSDRHIVEYYGELLGILGLKLKYQKPQMYLAPQDQEGATDILRREGVEDSDLLVGIIPAGGMSWGKEAYLKHWPAENFASLADKIIEKYQATIIIMGSVSEKEIGRRVKDQMQHKERAVDLCGKTDLRELAALLKKMKLLITNDGGPLHIGSALGVKTVSIFGPVDEKVYGPYPSTNRDIVIKKDLPCRPCYKNFRFPGCLYNRQCLQGISVEEVWEKIYAQNSYLGS